MSKERFVRNPKQNKKIDEQALRLLAVREIYYVPECNAFIAYKRLSDDGKVYSDPCNFMNDATTTIGNLLISDKYITEKCIHIKDLETLDKYAYQHDLSIKQFNTEYGSYRSNSEEKDISEETLAFWKMREEFKKNPEIKTLPDDPIEIDDDFDMWPDLDDRDDYRWDD